MTRPRTAASMARRITLVAALSAAITPALASSADARRDGAGALRPGDLLVSSSVYEEDKGLTAGVTQLPTGCTTECVTATAGGAYPEVWNNDLVDGNFGVASKIVLDELDPLGGLVKSIEVPNSTTPGLPGGADQMVTSFSSKSELSLNLSTGGRSVTFMGYLAPVGALDISNSNTPGVIDPTNPVPDPYYRVVAQLGRDGRFHFTKTNAFSGDNGRAAILNEEDGANLIYAAGNAGNGASPEMPGVIASAGAQLVHPSTLPEALQEPGQPTPLGSFSIAELGYPLDKAGKDDNFRGVTIFDKVVYFTKGSGGKGVKTVYFLDVTGKACPDGMGLPVPGAPLPSSPIDYNPETLQSEGLTPTNMCILKGFPTELKSKTSAPFGLWFANAHTLYVADEGNGKNKYSAESGAYTDAAEQEGAGLQKWVFDQASGEWRLAYTLQSGLDLGKPYSVPGYPTGENPATGLPWAPATDGLRDIAGRVNPDGTATIWAVTSTVSGGGDEGADPNRLVAITDPIGASSPAQSERFRTIRSAASGEVLRGVSFTPGTGVSGQGGHKGRSYGNGRGHDGHGRGYGRDSRWLRRGRGGARRR